VKIADAHCDTLTKYPENIFDSKDAQWSLPRYKEVGGELQYFAIFTPPEYSGSQATGFAINNIGNFLMKKPKNISLITRRTDYNRENVNILLSLEGAAPICNDMANLHAFFNIGVRAMGLTWNHRNFVADGIDNEYGLTVFGKEVVKEMETLGIIIDVSHLNENGFDDVVANAKYPFIASHSNARSIMEHKRNLNDEQIKELVKRGGFIGLNFYTKFVSDDGTNHKKELLKHIEHFLNLGAENVLGLGADFDGIDSATFDGVEGYSELYTLLKDEMELNETTIEKIMANNLIEYTLKMM